MKGNTYRDGKVHVMAESCDQCLLKPKTRLVSAEWVKEIVSETKDEEGATFTCHLASIAKQDAICRKWYDLFSYRDPLLTLAKKLGIIKHVTPPTK